MDATSTPRPADPAISVVIPTYNRRDNLAAALRSVLMQDGDVPYEVVVVDNNSTDGTAEVVLQYAEESSRHVRYFREGRQGAAHARNAGLALASASLIAFVDDDVRVARDWVTTTWRALTDNPDVDYVGGRVLPDPTAHRPAWLTDGHWSPLAILDYGDSPRYISAADPCVMLGANLAIRRAILDRVGQFVAAFQHLRNTVCGGAEDHELQLRIWAAGGRGLYVPDMVVTADIPPERLTKRYHRRWHSEHGILCSRMRVEEMIGNSGELLPDRQDDLQLFGAPAWLFRRWLRAFSQCLLQGIRGHEALMFAHETRVRYYTNYIRTRFRDTQSQRPDGWRGELGRFVIALLKKKLRLYAGVAASSQTRTHGDISPSAAVAASHLAHAEQARVHDGSSALEH